MTSPRAPSIRFSSLSAAASAVGATDNPACRRPKVGSATSASIAASASRLVHWRNIWRGRRGFIAMPFSPLLDRPP